MEIAVSHIDGLVDPCADKERKILCNCIGYGQYHNDLGHHHKREACRFGSQTVSDNIAAVTLLEQQYHMLKVVGDSYQQHNYAQNAQ